MAFRDRRDRAGLDAARRSGRRSSTSRARSSRWAATACFRARSASLDSRDEPLLVADRRRSACDDLRTRYRFLAARPPISSRSSSTRSSRLSRAPVRLQRPRLRAALPRATARPGSSGRRRPARRSRSPCSRSWVSAVASEDAARCAGTRGAGSLLGYALCSHGGACEGPAAGEGPGLKNKPRQRPDGRINIRRAASARALSPRPRGSVVERQRDRPDRRKVSRSCEQELDELKSVHRREVNDRIRQAKEYGDLSENAEYEDAKQEQAFIEGRILKLEAMIRNARIIDEIGVRGRRSPSRRDRQGQRSQEQRELRVHDRRLGRSRSAESPHLERVAARQRARWGTRRATTVDVATPRGVVKYKIESIKSNAPKKAAKKAS